MDIRLSQKLSQKLTLTPQMRQSLRILELPLLKLRSYIEIQVEENPALKQEDAAGEDSLFTEKIEKLIEQGKGPEDFGIGHAPDEISKKRDYRESLISKAPTLEEHLLKQLRFSPLSRKDCKIGEYILTNLDENGYLALSLKEITAGFNKNAGLDKQITREKAESVLRLIYNFDPPGIGAKNLKECLLIQLRLKNKKNSLTYKIVNLYLSELIKNKPNHIAKKLKVSLNAVANAVREISSLNPRPGKAFESIITQITAPSVPDIIIEKVDGKFGIIINTKFLPKLKISNYYLNLFKSKKIPPAAKKYIQEKINSALGLIKSISQREETIIKIVRNIVNLQKDFFERGDRSLLKPLTYRNIAKIVKRNESTVSRTINNKYAQTSYGIFKLSYFFSKSLETSQGKKISQEHVKHQILDILAEEDNKNLKDNEIVKSLEVQGIKIARRTVAKYRKELKIPSYHRRKK